jgi:hypothetical protein
MPATITDDVPVNGDPLKTEQARVLQVSAAASKQYVAGSRISWYQDLPRALPWAIDDVEGSFGLDIYARMLLDPQVKSTLGVLKSSILEEGITLNPAIDDKEDPDYDRAVAVRDEAEAMLSALDTALDDVLWDMLDALAYGYRMAEQTYDLAGGTYQLVLLQPKPAESVAFVVDPFYRVLGILGRIPGQPFPVQQGAILTNLESDPNFLPRSKFAVLTSRPKDGDPRGTSTLRAAFASWNSKQQVTRDYLKYLAQFATPSLIGFTADGADVYQLVDSNGDPMLDTNGNPVMGAPEQDMVTTLQQFAAGTASAFPYGARVQPIEMSGDGSAYINAIKQYDRQITKNILHQTLATEDSEHQTRASTGTHKDILDTIVRQLKRPVERMMERDVLHVWLRLNGRERDLDLCPIVTLGVAEQEDLAKLWTAVSGIGYTLDASQYPAVDEMLGFPEREAPQEPPPMPAPPQGQNQPPQTGQEQPPPDQQPPEGAQFSRHMTPDEEFHEGVDALSSDLHQYFEGLFRGE